MKRRTQWQFFADTFKPLDNSEGEIGADHLFETYGEEYERVKATDPNLVWTLIDGTNGKEYVIAGWHYVNRLAYLITEKPWKTGLETYLY